MVTENGTVKVQTAIDENMQKEYSVKAKIIGLVMLIGGSVGVGVCFVLFILSEFFTFLDDSVTIPFLIVFSVLFAGGLIITISLVKALQQVRNANKMNEYEFFSDYFTVTQFNNGEAVITAKYYNGQIMKVKESKNYYFIWINAAQVLPVSKAEIGSEEADILKQVLRINKTA